MHPKVPTLQSCAGLSGDTPPSWTTYRPTKNPLISTDSGVVEGGLLHVTEGAPLTQEIPRVLGALGQESDEDQGIDSYAFVTSQP